MIVRRIEFLIILIAGFVVTLDYFIVSPEWAYLSSFIQRLATILAAFALGIGAVTLLRLHIPIVQKRVPGKWYLSAWLVFVMCVTAIIGVLGGLEHPAFQWIFANVYLPLSATMFALLGFFIISASFRAFRARNLDAIVLLVTAAFIMLMNMPLGQIIWSGFPVIGEWFRDVAAVAGTRGITVALAIGVVVYCIRIFLGVERRERAGGG